MNQEHGEGQTGGSAGSRIPKGQLNLAIHARVEVACETPDCPNEMGQQIFFDPSTSLDNLGRSFEQRSLEAVEAQGWECINERWYCSECAKKTSASS